MTHQVEAQAIGTAQTEIKEDIASAVSDAVAKVQNGGDARAEATAVANAVGTATATAIASAYLKVYYNIVWRELWIPLDSRLCTWFSTHGPDSDASNYCILLVSVDQQIE